MPSRRMLKKRLDRKVIGDLGIDTVIVRASTGVVLDAWGEPSEGSPTTDNIPVRIVVDTDKRNNNPMDLGGMPDPSKEYVFFYTKGDFDIRMGDRVIYPPNSDAMWLVDRIDPQAFKGVNMITEVRAYRDNRYA